MLTLPPSGLLLVANGDNTQLIVYGVLLLLSVLGSILGSKKKPDEQRGRTGKPPTRPKAPRPARPGRVETPPAPPPADPLVLEPPPRRPPPLEARAPLPVEPPLRPTVEGQPARPLEPPPARPVSQRRPRPPVAPPPLPPDLSEPLRRLPPLPPLPAAERLRPLREQRERAADRRRIDHAGSPLAPGGATPSPVESRKAALTARELRQALRDPSSVRRAVLLAEILGPPVALRDWD